MWHVTTDYSEKRDKMSEDRVTTAFNEFMMELFGEVPKDVSERSIDREIYETKMKEIQDKHGLVQGDRDFLHWVFTLIGRSPKLIEGAGENE